MSIFHWLWHAVTGCPKADLDHTMYGTTHCRGCGRVNFVSDSLPRITRLKVPRRLNYM